MWLVESERFSIIYIFRREQRDTANSSSDNNAGTRWSHRAMIKANNNNNSNSLAEMRYDPSHKLTNCVQNIVEIRILIVVHLSEF